MNLKEYIKKYFARFPKKKHMILKGHSESIMIKDEMKNKLKSESNIHDFDKYPIYYKKNHKNVYILISNNKDNYLNYEVLYNYNISSSKRNNHNVSRPDSNNKPNRPETKPSKNESKEYEKPNKPVNEVRPISIMLPEKSESNSEKPKLSNNRKKNLGYGILETHQLNLYSSMMNNQNCKIYLEKGNFMMIKYERSGKTEHGKFQIISHNLFKEETNMELNVNSAYNVNNEKDNYNKIKLNFTYYDDMNPKTYGTHYCLDKNAVQWKINKGPDYGSYAFSIPPFPDCPDTTPASFIFALQEDQYNKLKEDGTKMINVFTSVVYMVDNKKIEKNIEFVMNLK